MKLKYIGKSFGVDSLTNGKTYIATIGDSDYYRVFDDSGEDYMYPRDNPSLTNGTKGKWEIIEGMNEREKELDKQFDIYEKIGDVDKLNALRKETIKICAEYAVKYKKEIEEAMK